MNLILRLLRTTWQNIYRHGLTSLVAVVVTTMFFLLFNVLLFGGYFQQAAMDTVNSRLDLALNFKKDVETFQIDTLMEELKATFPEIHKVQFVSSQIAFQRFIQNFGKNNQELSRWLQAHTTVSPLPATLVISIDAQYHDEILRFITTSRFNQLLEIQSLENNELASIAAAKVISLNATISKINFIATLIFSLLAVLIITAIVRLTILSRYTEVTIMRLVGATRRFVQIPFILEGIFFGIVGSVVSSFTFLLVVSRFDTSILAGSIYGGFGELFKIASNNYLDKFQLLLIWQIIAAIFIGTIASLIATRRYLKRDLVF